MTTGKTNHKEGTMHQMYRQGDVLLVAAQIPNGTVLSRQPRVRVAEGEVTGHAHVIEAPDQGEVMVDTDVEFVRIMGANGLLVHEEHSTIELPPGDYRVVRQREYSPEEIRPVAD